MSLGRFLLDEGKARPHRLALAATAASAASVILLGVVNLAAETLSHPHRDAIDGRLALAFVVAGLIYYLAERDLVAQIGAAMEHAIHAVRMRLIDAVQEARLAEVETLGSEALFDGITQSARALSANSQFIALSIRSALLTAMVLLYILWLSVPGFLLVLAATGAAGVLYYRLGTRLRRRYGEMMDAEQRLFAVIEDLIHGFREVRLSSPRRDALKAHFERVSARATLIRIDVQSRAFRQLVAGHVSFFFMLAVVVFVLPAQISGFSDDVVKTSAAVIFMIGPLGGVIQAVTVLASAGSAAQRMLALDAQLQAMREPAGGITNLPPLAHALQLTAVSHAYPAVGNEAPFCVGPIDLRIARGETLFITGGNGSGKSTFLKLLTGLYVPREGWIALDDTVIGDDNRQAWREQFATVFADHHLFARTYGAADDELTARRAAHWLGVMELDHLIHFHAGRFNRTELSSGQRKRVLLVAALLLARPVLVLDEWAADQDPYFRRKFYREILPMLKAEGYTIIAVTHDDHYFDVCDRRIHLEQGRIIAPATEAA